MKKIIFIFLLLAFSANVFAQAHQLVLYRIDGKKDSAVITVGAHIKVGITDGGVIKGQIQTIGSDYFILDFDTVRLEQVVDLRYAPRHPNKLGKIVMLSGVGVFVAGAGMIIASESARDGLSLLVYGALTCVVGIPVIVIGGIITLTEMHVKRRIDSHWGLKIV